MQRIILVLLVVTLAVIYPINGNAIRFQLGNRLSRVNTDEERVEVFQEFTTKTEDIDLLREIQDAWMEIDQNSARNYFSEWFQDNKNSALHHYLWARSLEDFHAQQDEARKIVKAHPDFRYGYLLLSYLYNHHLFQGEPLTGVDTERLQKTFPDDEKYINEWLKRLPGDDEALYTLFYMNLWRNKEDEAEKYILQTKGKTSYWANFQVIVEFSRTTGKINVFEQLFPEIISRGIESGTIAPSDSLSLYGGYYVFILRDRKKWDAIDEYIKRYPELMEVNFVLRSLISANIARENYETAINYLDQLLDKGVISYQTINFEDEWQVLSEAPSWNTLIAKAKNKWDEETEIRKNHALAEKKNIEAPAWELEDIDGNVVKLEDYRGKVVVLDFWATWCAPCRTVMPMIDEWMKDNMLPDVKVFSINVWEQAPERAKEYFTENNFAMTYLIGTDDLPTLYNFGGIPHIVVIDKEGIIRYEESGVSENFEEKLSWWVEDLL